VIDSELVWDRLFLLDMSVIDGCPYPILSGHICLRGSFRLLWIKHGGQEFPVKGLPIPRFALGLPDNSLRFASQAFLVQSMGNLP